MIYIGQGAFRSCERLIHVTLPEGIPEICDETFKECLSLQRINIPDSVTSIGRDAFRNCEHLNHVCIPEHVEEIGKDAFYSCLWLDHLEISGHETRMEECGAGYGTFLDYNLYDGYFENSGKVSDDFTIYCKRRSPAEKYAKQHRFKVSIIKKGRK